MNNTLKPTGRTLYFDILRAISCLCVVMIHATGAYHLSDIGTSNYWLGIFLEAPARLAVPVFAMLSGALMLDEGYHYTKEKCKAHILKMVLFFCFWSAAYCGFHYVAYNLFKGLPLDIPLILQELLNGHYHLWFVPMIIGFYMILPLLRLWIKAENRKYIQYFLILWYLFSCLIPQLRTLAGMSHENFSLLWILPTNLRLNYVSGLTGYFILGWYLHTAQISTKARPALWCWGLAAVVISFVGTGVISTLTGTHESLYAQTSPLMPIWAGCIFCLVKLRFSGVQYGQGLFYRAVAFVCDNSLGVYGVHVAMLTLFTKLVPLPKGIAQLLCVYILSVIGSLCVTAVLKKLPLLRKIV